jgi:hypothetical protein
MRKLLHLLAIIQLLATGCSSLNARNRPSGLPARYHDAQYDFTFFLPARWQGHSVLIQKWEGVSCLPAKDTTAVTAHGPIIVLRHPQWKADDPSQDIPIMVFTRSQWDALHSGEWFPYAGGVIGEMWQTRKHVFAIYSRYNADDSVKGWNEADRILGGNSAAHATPHLYPE